MLGRKQETETVETPRASLVAIGGELCEAAILMGGAHTLHGNDVRLDGIERAWVVDVAGEMPLAYRAAAGKWFVRVFPDLDGEIPALPRLRDLAAEVARDLRAADGYGPDRLLVMCHHGMNRSGLVTGLVLRELGLSGDEAVSRIVRARPGSLSNHAFRTIVEGDQGGELVYV